MHNLEFAGGIDVTTVVLSTFVLFFVGLVIYLRREDRREGYPLEDDVTGRLETAGGLFFTAAPKTFLRPHEGPLTKPDGLRDTHELSATRTSRAPGSPLEPVGDPLLAGVGPGAFAHRAHRPDVMLHNAVKIAPLRIADGYSIDPKDPDPRGMPVVGADDVVAGAISDVWVDRAEFLIRYLEVELTGGTKRVLIPMPMAIIDKAKSTIRVSAILGSQFALAPTLESPNQITFAEEDRVSAFFGGGFLYATASRSEPYL